MTFLSLIKLICSVATKANCSSHQGFVLAMVAGSLLAAPPGSCNSKTFGMQKLNRQILIAPVEEAFYRRCNVRSSCCPAVRMTWLCAAVLKQLRSLPYSVGFAYSALLGHLLLPD